MFGTETWRRWKLWRRGLWTLKYFVTQSLNIKLGTHEKLFIWSKIVAVFPLKENGFSRFFHWFITLESVWVIGTCGWLGSWFSGWDGGWSCLFVFEVDWDLFRPGFGFRSGNCLPLRSFCCWFDSLAVDGDWFRSGLGGLSLFGAAYFRRFTSKFIVRRLTNYQTFHYLTGWQWQ